MQNVTLIGMPGSGKSTIGVLLAKRLGFSFIDVDLVIQEKEERLLKEIIADEGLEGFLEIENRINAGLEADRAIIAPGGSVIYGREAMEHLKETGLVVYLKIDYDALTERLGNLTDRGVALKDGMTLKDLYEERVPLYESYADITIDEEGKEPGDIVDELRDILEKRFGCHKKLTYMDMKEEHLSQMSSLYVKAFNIAPWNDAWTEERAGMRLLEMLRCSGAYGMVTIDEDGKLCGLILGNAETYYNGVHFIIKEFCVDVSLRGAGTGGALLKKFESRLAEMGINEIYLFTSRSNGTADYYTKRGYQQYDSMSMLGKKIN